MEQPEHVQELAESGVGAPPVRYINSEDRRPVTTDPPSVPLPVVDLSRLFQSGGDNDEAEKLRSALQSWGMFQAVGHEMSLSFLDEVRNMSRKFFHLPMIEKKKYSIGQGNDFMQGYGNERLVVEDQILDWVDRLYLLVQPEDARKLELWPESPSNFRDVLNEYTMKTNKVSEQVLRSMSKLLELNEDHLSNHFGDKAQVFARFNYYPCCSRPDLVFGIKPHSDGSAFTIVLPDKDVEGLQVLKNGEWVKVPTIPHALIVNMGDQMEIMSNGIFKSPVHRVLTNPDKDRISVAMFHPLEAEKELKPLDGLVDEARPALYKTMITKEYLGVYFQHFVQGNHLPRNRKKVGCMLIPYKMAGTYTYN